MKDDTKIGIAIAASAVLFFGCIFAIESGINNDEPVGGLVSNVSVPNSNVSTSTKGPDSTSVINRYCGLQQRLSRAIVFFPFFLAGFYGKEYGKVVFPQCFGVTISHKQILRVTTATVAVGIAILLFEYRKGIKVSWLYQSAAYEKWHYNAAIRLGAIICAVLMIHFLCVCTPNRKIPFVTKLGQNTMPVFLLHGFVIRLLKYYPIPVMKQYPVLWSVLLIVLLLFVLSSKTVKKLCKPILSYPF